MKRRTFLSALSILPSMLISCGKDEFPDRPTIITGKVIDENNKPIVGIQLVFGGYYLKGFSPIPTFDEIVETDKDGIYKISYIVPRGQAYLKPLGNTQYDLVTFYDIYIWKNNSYEKMSSSAGQIINGETNTFNFQLRKK